MTVKDSLRDATDRVLGTQVVTSVSDRLNRDSVRVLAYHGVPDRQRFREQVALLAHEANPISAEMLIAAFEGRQALPKRPVLITFDDGDISVLENGLPILREAGLPSVAFVVTDLIGTETPFWWVEVKEQLKNGAEPAPGLTSDPLGLVGQLKHVSNQERLAVIDDLRLQTGASPKQRNLQPDDLHAMRAGGMEIGSHTRTHPCLDRCADAVIREEVVGAASRLTELTGAQPSLFAYPNGNVDGRARQAVQDAGHSLGFLFDHDLARTTQDPLMLSRLRVNATDTLPRLRASLSGAHPRALHTRRHIKAITRRGSRLNRGD